LVRLGLWDPRPKPTVICWVDRGLNKTFFFFFLFFYKWTRPSPTVWACSEEAYGGSEGGIEEK